MVQELECLHPTENAINLCRVPPINNNKEHRVSIHREVAEHEEVVPASLLNHVTDDRLLQLLMAKSFKVSLSLRKKESEDPVHFKQDGQRFEKPHTLKLNQATEYTVRVSIRPETELL